RRRREQRESPPSVRTSSRPTLYPTRVISRHVVGAERVQVDATRHVAPRFRRRYVPGWMVMRLPTLRRTRSAAPGVIGGAARLDRRTKRLVGRLRPGDIAVIDHVDLDRVAADSLVAVGVTAVLNAKTSLSGRYPNLGPEALIKAGITLVDDLGEDLFRNLREGD